MASFSGWIFDDSVEYFCEAVSRWVGYPWDHADRDAFLGAIEATGEELDVWFSYPIMGSPPLELRFSLNRGGGVVSILVEGELDSVLLARRRPCAIC